MDPKLRIIFGKRKKIHKKRRELKRINAFP